MGRDGEISQCNRSPMDHSFIMSIMLIAVTLGSLACTDSVSKTTITHFMATSGIFICKDLLWFAKAISNDIKELPPPLKLVAMI